MCAVDGWMLYLLYNSEIGHRRWYWKHVLLMVSNFFLLLCPLGFSRLRFECAISREIHLHPYVNYVVVRETWKLYTFKMK